MTTRIRMTSSFPLNSLKASQSSVLPANAKSVCLQTTRKYNGAMCSYERNHRPPMFPEACYDGFCGNLQSEPKHEILGSLEKHFENKIFREKTCKQQMTFTNTSHAHTRNYSKYMQRARRTDHEYELRQFLFF